MIASFRKYRKLKTVKIVAQPAGKVDFGMRTDCETLRDFRRRPHEEFDDLDVIRSS